MVMKYDDEACYRFHARDLADRCFVCQRDGQRLLIVRQIADMMLVHLCSDCMIRHLDEYMLDNTRPWKGPV
jgi:recombinational DNA repair protein RecR